MAFTRDTTRELSQTLLRARNPNIEITGLSFGDSTLFVGDRNRTAVYGWTGDTWEANITRRRLRDAARSAALRFSDNPTNARLNVRVGSVVWLGDSTIAVGDTGNNYLLILNSESGAGDTSRHIKLPSSFNPVGLVDSGDSYPWLYDKTSGTVKEWKNVNYPAQYRTETYTETIYETVTIPGEKRTEYRVSGERGSGSVNYSCSDKEGGSSQYFRKNRTRYNRQSTWDTDRNTAIRRARRNETVRTHSGAIQRGGDLSGYCSIGTTTTTISTRTYTELCSGRSIAGHDPTCTERSFLTQRTTTVTVGVRPPSNRITTYSPIIETRQIDTSTTTIRARQVQRTRQILVRSAFSRFEWVDKITNSTITRILGTSAAQIGGLTSDTDRNIYLVTNTKAWYFSSPTGRSTEDTRHDFSYPAINSQAAAWGNSGLYLADTDNDRINFYKREDIILRFSGGEPSFRFQPVQPPKPAWTREDGDSKDIDLISDLGFGGGVDISGLAHDGTYLYFSDRNSQRVFKVNLSNKTAEGFITQAQVGAGTDSLTFGDSRLWLGIDSRRTLETFFQDGRSENIVYSLPSNTIPSGIAHNGDTDIGDTVSIDSAGTRPYVIDAARDKIISWKKRKNIIPPIFGDSFFNHYLYETQEQQRIITKYRVTGDTQGPSSYISCTNHGDSEWRTAERYRASDVLYDSQSAAQEASKYDSSYKTFCEQRSQSYTYQEDETYYVRVLVTPARTEYRVTGERVSGSRKFPCTGLSAFNFTYRTTRTRYRSSGWSSSSSAAQSAASYTQNITGSARVYDSPGYWPSGTCRLGSYRDRTRGGQTRYRYSSAPSYSVYSPIIQTRSVPAVYRQEPRTRKVTRRGTRNVYSKEIKTWTPLFQEIGDTVTEEYNVQLIRKEPIKVVRTPGDSSNTITGWGDEVSTETLRSINPTIRPTGLTFNDNKDLFVLDADRDQVYFLHQGFERRPEDAELDLSTGNLRQVNQNIFPTAIAWDHDKGFYIADSYNKKIWWFKFNPRIHFRVSAGTPKFDFKVDSYLFKAIAGVPKASFNVTVKASPTIRASAGIPTVNFRANSAPPISLDFVGGTPSVSFNVRNIPSTKVAWSASAGSPTLGFKVTPQTLVKMQISGESPTFNFKATKQILFKLHFIGGSPTASFLPKLPVEASWSASAGIPTVSFTAKEHRITRITQFKAKAGVPVFSFDAEASPNLYFSWSANAGIPEFNFNARSYLPGKSFVAWRAVGGAPTLDFRAIHQVPAPNFGDTYVDISEIPIELLPTPANRSELAKYKAQGKFEQTANRFVSPRAQTGQIFSAYPYNEHEITREPTILGPGIPQLLPLTLTVTQQGQSVILTWNEEEGLYEPAVEIQVSQNENGPWYSPDPSGTGRISIGDSGGFLTARGFEQVLPNVPLKGTTEIPEPRSLCYRARRVDRDMERSDWSAAQMVTVQPIKTGEYGSRTISAPKLTAKIFGDQGVGNKLAYWSMDDTPAVPFEIGTLKDTSQEGVPNPLRITGDQIIGVDNGRVGKGIFIDGRNNTSFAITNRIGDTGDSWSALSMQAFIKTGSQQYENIVGLLSYWRSTTERISIDYIKNTKIFRLRIGNILINSNPIDLFNNAWRQIGFSYNAATKEAKLYLDGAEVKSQIITITKTSILQGGYFGVGGIAGNNTVGFKMRGIIDEVRVWNRVLSLEEFIYFNNDPKGTSASEFISGDQILRGTIRGENLAFDAIQTSTLAAKEEIKTGPKVGFTVGDTLPTNTKGDYQGHLDADEVILQEYGDTSWINNARLYQNSSGGHLSLKGDSSDLQTDPDSIIITRGNNRTIQTSESFEVYQKINNSWVIKSQQTNSKIVFYGDSGQEMSSIGADINFGDTVNFGTYVISKKNNILDFSGEISANAFVPENRFINNTNIIQSNLFTLLNNSITTFGKINGYGVLNTPGGGNIVFEGPIIIAQKGSSTTFYLHGFNVISKTAQTLTVSENNSTKVFDTLTMEF